MCLRRGPPREYLARHPFGRIPAFEHDGFQLFETGAITRYIDGAFAGPALQPPDPRRRARMNQIVSLLDNYAYRTLVWDLFVERVRVPAQGRQPDEARIAAAVPHAETCLDALVALMADSPYLAGPDLTLADLTDPAMRRFTVAHELGHYLLHHPSPSIAEMYDPTQLHGLASLLGSVYEAEANAFARELLMPEPLVRLACDLTSASLDPALRIAYTFGVSVPTSAVRFVELTDIACTKLS